MPAEHRSGIYFHTEAQRKVAEASLAAQNEKLGGRVVTEIQKVSLRPRAVEQRPKGGVALLQLTPPAGPEIACPPALPACPQVDNYSEAEEYHQRYLERGGREGRAQSAAKGCSDPIRCYG